MASASPSEFLTFYRRVASSNGALRRGLTARPLTAARPFHVSRVARTGDHFDDKQHATRKEDNLDIQSREAKKGQQSKQTDTGGVATRQKDETGSVAKSKQEFPESPDPVIGMQDERGGKGH